MKGVEFRALLTWVWEV